MITPILLCGGSGTRLWPLSRKSYPKQFVPLVGDETLFQASARRLSGAGYAPALVLTASDFRFIVTEQLQEAGLDPGAILIEPSARNTAPAILAAALHLAATDPQALMLVAPSDHVVPDAGAFRAAVEAGVPAARAGQIVTFGITPTHPETGYGYLELGEAPDGSGRAVALRRFVEKPDADVARDMLEAGNFLWNAGIFLFAARDVIAAFEAHAPQLMAPCRAALEQGAEDIGLFRLGAEAYGAAKAISFDYAVMEKAGRVAAVHSPAGGRTSVPGTRSGRRPGRMRPASPPTVRSPWSIAPTATCVPRKRAWPWWGWG